MRRLPLGLARPARDRARRPYLKFFMKIEVGDKSRASPDTSPSANQGRLGEKLESSVAYATTRCLTEVCSMRLLDARVF
jgi:hypothetical protein